MWINVSAVSWLVKDDFGESFHDRDGQFRSSHHKHMQDLEGTLDQGGHSFSDASNAVSKAQFKILTRVKTPMRSKWKARRHSVAIMQEVRAFEKVS